MHESVIAWELDGDALPPVRQQPIGQRPRACSRIWRRQGRADECNDRVVVVAMFMRVPRHLLEGRSRAARVRIHVNGRCAVHSQACLLHQVRKLAQAQLAHVRREHEGAAALK